MINDLINEITDGQVPLSQSLMRAKVIARKLKDDTTLEWVAKELTGYPKTSLLPEERKIRSDVYFTENDGGTLYTFPCTYASDVPLDLKYSLSSYSCYDSIPSILSHLQTFSSTSIKVTLSDIQLAVLSNPYRQLGHNVVSGYYQFPIGAVNRIIENVRQRLFDSLIVLSEQCPDVAIEKSKLDKIEINNMVVTYMNGDHNSANIATGSVVSQQNSSNTNEPYQ